MKQESRSKTGDTLDSRFRIHDSRTRTHGFTLIETLVAISLLTVAIVAPMTLASQSLSAAYYARDQITAYNLAQEGIESVRALRDGQILLISQSSNASGINLFGAIPIDRDFRIDSRESDPVKAITTCSDDPGGVCKALQTDGTLYGYDADTEAWPSTYFVRTLHANYVDGNTDEIRVTVTVSWPTASQQRRSFTIFSNLYRWVNDGSASH